MTDPILSVYIATYKHGPYIGQAIESVLGQITSYPYEIIIVDDCSPDNTWDVIQDFLSKHPEKIRAYQTSQNTGNGRRAMFDVRPSLKGKYIAFLDGDDFWYSKDKLHRQIEFLENNPDYVGSTHPTCVHIEYEEGKDWMIGSHPNDSWNFYDILLHEHRLYCHTSSYIWRFNCKQDDGFFFPDYFSDPIYYNDTPIVALIAGNGGKIKHIKDIATVWRQTGKGEWTSLDDKDKLATYVREFVAMNYITEFRYHRIIQQRIKILRAQYVRDFGEEPPRYIPELMPDAARNILKQKGLL